MQIDWNQIKPIWTSSLSKDNQSELFSVSADEQQRNSNCLSSPQESDDFPRYPLDVRQ